MGPWSAARAPVERVVISREMVEAVIRLRGPREAKAHPNLAVRSGMLSAGGVVQGFGLKRKRPRFRGLSWAEREELRACASYPLGSPESLRRGR